MDAPITQHMVDDPDFPLEMIPCEELREMLDDPSHPELEHEHPDQVEDGPGDTIEDEEWMEQVIDNEPLW
jgi:hypothetical protein